jgi:hypothetical protein
MINVMSVEISPGYPMGTNGTQDLSESRQLSQLPMHDAAFASHVVDLIPHLCVVRMIH